MVDAIVRMPPAGEIVAAMNNDSQGRQLAELVHRAFLKTKIPEARFTIDEPPHYNDWNDELHAQSKT